MHVLQHKFCYRGQLSQSVFPDLWITTDDAGSNEHILAHRVVLAAVSPWLFFKCKAGGTVVIRNIQYRVLEEVVRFIYTGSIEVKNMNDVNNLRHALDKLQIKLEIDVRTIIDIKEEESEESATIKDFLAQSAQGVHHYDASTASNAHNGVNKGKSIRHGVIDEYNNRDRSNNNKTTFRVHLPKKAALDKYMSINYKNKSNLDEKKSKRVFIGGLSPRVRKKDIERFLIKYGRLREICIRRNMAFVEFGNYRDAEDAVYDMNGTELMGRRVAVEHVKNLPRSLYDKNPDIV